MSAKEVRAWRNRALERLYPLVFQDAILVKMREGGQLANRAVYVALGVNPDGAKFRLQVLTEPNNCGV